jgi:hypothetical protein
MNEPTAADWIEKYEGIVMLIYAPSYARQNYDLDAKFSIL